MTRNSDPWLRFYVRTLNNPKVQQLTGTEFKGWVNLLCLAKEFDGSLPPVEDVAFRLRLSKQKAETLLKSLRSNGLIDGDKMHDWDEMQYNSDSSTERVKQHRERQRNVTGNVTSVSETVSETVQSQRRVESEESRGESESDTEVLAAKNGKPRAATTDTWAAYSKSYLTRYSVLPTRNAKVNSQLAQFCKRVPASRKRPP